MPDTQDAPLAQSPSGRPVPLVRTTSLTKVYRRGPQEIRAVDNVDLQIEAGEFMALVGSSGSGKSTLLNLLAGLDTPTSGEIAISGRPLSTQSPEALAQHRASMVGMVFQAFNLVGHRTALQNVELAMYFNGTPREMRRPRATDILQRIGLGDRLGHVPSDLSGGEQQRVAIARALVKQPKMLFADEPTGNLDRTHAHDIALLLSELNREGLTIVLVTHDIALAERFAQRIEQIDYGRLVGGSVGRAGK
jgi:putative ABC transport system ATP-binding protein